MPQQLNLYTRSLCQSRHRDTFGQMLVAQAAIATLGMLTGAVLQWGAGQARSETATLVQQSDIARSALKQTDADTANGHLDAQVQRLRSQETGLRRIQGLLDNGSAGRRQGYAEHLEALARQAHASVWITGLTLQGADDSIELQGRMTDPAMLTDYLRQLQAEPRFKGRSFAALSIRRSGGDTGTEGTIQTTPRATYSEFTLRSHAAKGNGHGIDDAPASGPLSAATAAQAAVQVLLTPGALVPKP
jgi:Tfp pilus assembly protein PilN